MVKKMREITAGKPEKKDSDATNESPNRGKLIIDATCAPADPPLSDRLRTIKLCPSSHKKNIDILYKHIKAKFPKKPITDRNLAIIEYLVVTGGKTILPKQKNKSDSKTTPIYQNKLSSY
jgi:hypothetical protein